MNEAFDLAPWELSPDSPEQAQGVASGRVKGDWLAKKDQEFLIRTVQISPGVPVRFARPVDSTEEGNWVFYDAAPVGHSMEAWIERRLFYVAPNTRLGRLLHLSFEPYEAAGRGLLVLNNEGHGHLRWNEPRRSTAYINDVLFAFDFKGLNQRANAVEWKHRIEQELEAPGSDVRFALDWVQFSASEQKERLLSFGRGSLEELQDVWRQVLRCDARFNSSGDYWWWDWNVLTDAHWLDDDHGGEGLVQLWPFLRMWNKALLDWFQVNVARSLLRSHPRALTALVKGFDKTFQIEPFDSHHERLEAALELRDWARGKVPDELLRTLL